MSAEDLATYEREVRRSLRNDEETLQKLQQYRSEVASTRGMLEELPKRLTHNIAVPFGRHAFFLGQLQHTNEVSVHLGSSIYAECTASHAASILGRRLTRLDHDLVRQVRVQWTQAPCTDIWGHSTASSPISTPTLDPHVLDDVRHASIHPKCVPMRAPGTPGELQD
jgi:prefoldin subunit 5